MSDEKLQEYECALSAIFKFCTTKKMLLKLENIQGFDNQERNLTFVKTAFQVLKLKFLACIWSKSSILFKKQTIARA